MSGAVTRRFGGLVDRFVEARAPAERLAAFRIITGVFAVGYLLLRLPVFVDLASRSDVAFESVGVLTPLSATVPGWTVGCVIAIALASGSAYVVGWRARATTPVFALAMLLLTTYRGSFGQLLHFENLIVLHLVVMSCAPASDVWSLDARRVTTGVRPLLLRRGDRDQGGEPDESVEYGWPLALAGLIVVVSYVITGVAKLRYGGLDWVFGDTLRNHIAYSAARLDLLGASPSPFARSVVGVEWILPPMAAATVVLELGAPVAFLRHRVRDVWVVGIWTMHVAIFAFMLVGFPYPLFGVAFAPFYRIERLFQVPLHAVATWRPTNA